MEFSGFRCQHIFKRKNDWSRDKSDYWSTSLCFSNTKNKTWKFDIKRWLPTKPIYFPSYAHFSIQNINWVFRFRSRLIASLRRKQLISLVMLGLFLTYGRGSQAKIVNTLLGGKFWQTVIYSCVSSSSTTRPSFLATGVWPREIRLM